jgi:hypothetical protein
VDAEKLKECSPGEDALWETDDICWTKREITKITGRNKDYADELVKKGKLDKEKVVLNGTMKNIYYLPENGSVIEEIING